ncbi:MAG: TetR/AcrR family transcriptional regulator [Ignavibacteria bacterium]
MKKYKHKSTEEKILESARRIFQKKGMYGTRMQEIADDAGINKALLHYYFRSKRKLFEVVFQDSAKKMFQQVFNTLDSKLPLSKKIEKFVHSYIDIISKYSYLPAFIIHEVNQNSPKVKKVLGNLKENPALIFIDEIKKHQKKGEIAKIDPLQILVNIISLCVFPIAVKPVIQMMYDLDEKLFWQFIEERKSYVVEVILNSLNPKQK